jgi:predicted dehydrogenase
VKPENPQNPRRLRIAVVGCGKVAQNVHLPALAMSRRCELVAVCDSSRVVADGLGRQYGLETVYYDVDDVLADVTIEALIVAVGDPEHVAVATRALEAGKDVLVEKPLGTSAAECHPLRQVVERTSRILQVGVMKRHDPGVEYARAAIGELGKVQSFALWYRASDDRFVDENSIFLPVLRDPQYVRPTYKLERQAYYLATHGSHVFDMVRYVVGDPISVQAVLHVGDGTYSWHGMLRLANGAVGNVELTVYVEGEWAEGFDVYGDRGSVAVRTPNPFFLRPSRVRVFDGATPRTHEPVFTEGNPYLRQLDAFASSVLDGAPVVAGVDDGIAALDLIEATAASAADGGRTVDLNIVG